MNKEMERLRILGIILERRFQTVLPSIYLVGRGDGKSWINLKRFYRREIMESYMDWVNNHFTEANNGKYLEMYKLADSSIKRFLDEGFDTVRYHDEGKDKQMCMSFIRDDVTVFLTFNQDTQRWLVDFKKEKTRNERE